MLAPWIWRNSHALGGFVPLRSNFGLECTIGNNPVAIAGEQRILTAGDTYRIPPGAAHGARVFEEPTQVIDVYAPPRTDLFPKA